ncbi:sigma-70 family RNA polymerase sigma factor [Streptomyces sp. tea 10]|nr:sigma-70 family RNA polymerase sigma factor [Streptomyces sp. tea 10]
MPIHTEAEFTDVYRAHYEDVLRFVRRRAHSMNVDDIVGETFLAAWRRRRELPAHPRPWLFGVARNVMLNADRSARRQSALVVHIRQATEAGCHETAIDATAQVDSRIDLVAAWQSLTPADQEVLALHVWEELTRRRTAHRTLRRRSRPKGTAAADGSERHRPSRPFRRRPVSPAAGAQHCAHGGRHTGGRCRPAGRAVGSARAWGLRTVVGGPSSHLDGHCHTHRRRRD